MKIGVKDKARIGLTPGVRILSVLGPDGLTIVQQVTGKDIEKVAGVVSKRVAEKLAAEGTGRVG